LIATLFPDRRYEADRVSAAEAALALEIVAASIRSD
jgi:hypothetical protein